jgi:hypothetical protein
MDLSSIRNAQNEFSNATPVDASSFLLGAHLSPLPAQSSHLMDLLAPSDWDIALVEDFTQSDALEIDYPCGQAEPALSLFYNAQKSATEVRLDGVPVALVQMRTGHGPLRASAIRLVPDIGLAAQFGTHDQATRAHV